MNQNGQRNRAVITGAGSGLGRALALRLAADGWRVAATDVDAERAQQTAEAVTAAGGEGLGMACDVRRAADFERVAERLRSVWGGLDWVVNNAGVASGGTVADTPLGDWEWMLDINLMGAVRGCHVLLSLLQGGGRVINVASFAGFAGVPGMAAYNVAKAGVIALSETLRAELADVGIGVTVVCPSFFATNLLQSFRSPRPGQRGLMEHLMEKSDVTAESIADDIVRAAQGDEFLVISHARAREALALKRRDPEAFFRETLASTRAFVATDDDSAAGS